MKWHRGQTVTVHAMDENHPSTPRLMQMGLVPGTQFEVLRMAPLGDPIVIRVRGYTLALRKRDLLALKVAL